MVEEIYSVSTYVLGFVEKNNILMLKNGLLARTSYQIKPLRLKRPLDGLDHVVELPLRKHYNVFAEGCLLDLSPTLVVEKTGPIEEQAIRPSVKLSSSFDVRLVCALSACFMHVFSLLELLTEAVHMAMQSMSLDSVGVMRV